MGAQRGPQCRAPLVAACPRSVGVGEQAGVASSLLAASDAERLVEGLVHFGVAEMGSSEWLRQHVALQKLNVQAHVNARNQSDPFVLEAVLTFDKMGVLLQELFAAEAWSDRVWPHIRAGNAVPSSCSSKAYYLVRPAVAPASAAFRRRRAPLATALRAPRLLAQLYHEAVLVNMLEVFCFHDYALEAMGDGLVDLIDYVMRRVAELVTRGARMRRGLPADPDVGEDNAEPSTAKDMEAEMRRSDGVVRVRDPGRGAGCGGALCDPDPALLCARSLWRGSARTFASALGSLLSRCCAMYLRTWASCPCRPSRASSTPTTRRWRWSR